MKERCGNQPPPSSAAHAYASSPQKFVLLTDRIHPVRQLQKRNSTIKCHVLQNILVNLCLNLSIDYYFTIYLHPPI